jgi:hypothetical protein
MSNIYIYIYIYIYIKTGYGTFSQTMITDTFNQTTRSAYSSLQTPLNTHIDQLIQEWKKTLKNWLDLILLYADGVRNFV